MMVDAGGEPRMCLTVALLLIGCRFALPAEACRAPPCGTPPPSISDVTARPTASPTFPTIRPSASPSSSPTPAPSASPTIAPSAAPSASPTIAPTTPCDVAGAYVARDGDGDGACDPHAVDCVCYSCPPGTLNYATGLASPWGEAAACDRCPFAERCAGGAACAPSYEGPLCGNCAPRHFLLNSKCRPCPDVPWSLVAMGVLVVVAVWHVSPSPFSFFSPPPFLCDRCVYP